MNENHARVCGSQEWAAHIQDEVLPALLRHGDLGQQMLEVGPGPGAATEWLRHKVSGLTAVEVDESAAAALVGRYEGSNVTVVVGDATALDFAAGSFDSVGCFTMLHHVPTRGMQNAILAEALRVLRPGGMLLGSDSLASDDLHQFHCDDRYNPVDPAWLLSRLQDAGCARIVVEVDWMLKFAAHKPT
ncbi:MAG TPA: class I SAM-dependent methyltransferase [Streptosporangiaceae bacterium]|nr:class I SAM-dependent methyltransferase [Streptosporangiaceae bacterium]